MTALLEPVAAPAEESVDVPRRRLRWPSGRHWDAILPASLVLALWASAAAGAASAERR